MAFYTDDESAGRLIRATEEFLSAAGPQPVEKVMASVDTSVLAYLHAGGLRADELRDAFVEEAVSTDRIWSGPNDVLGAMAQLLDDVVFTHRLTADEAERGVVAAYPDLDLLDWATDALSVDGGTVRRDRSEHVSGEDTSVYVGPPGWLDGFAPDDLLAFRLRNERLEVTRVGGALANDDAVVIGLARVAAERIRPGLAEEVYPLLIDLLCLVPSAFRAPIRPVDELLVSANLERRGFSIGRAGEEWQTSAEAIRDDRRARAVAEWRLDDCCVDAFDLCYEAFLAFVVGEDFEPADVATALLHGDVADAVADALLRNYRPDNVTELVDVVLAHAPERDTAGALVLLARAREEAGDGEGAESALRSARAADPAFGPAAWHLADYEVDRGNVTAALALLHHPDVPPEPDRIAALAAHRRNLETAFAGVGRNDPCPCGSGRKFKQCCQGAPPPLARRTQLLTYKLVEYAMSARRSTVVGIASSALDLDDRSVNPITALRAMSDDGFVIDVAVHEGGIGEDYLEARGTLLPVDERALVEAILAAPRRLVEVTGMDRGVSVTVRDAVSGESFTLEERTGSRTAKVGAQWLVRIAPVGDAFQAFGVILAITPERRESALALLANDDADADDIVRWYGSQTS